MIVFKIILPFTLHALRIFLYVFEVSDGFKTNEFFLSSHAAKLQEMHGILLGVDLSLPQQEVYICVAQDF